MQKKFSKQEVFNEVQSDDYDFQTIYSNDVDVLTEISTASGQRGILYMPVNMPGRIAKKIFLFKDRSY